MNVTMGIAAVCLVVGMAAGCTTARTGDSSEPATRGSGSVASQATKTSVSGSSPAPSDHAPSEAYARGLQLLMGAPSVTYSVASAIQGGTNSIRIDREVSVDAHKQLASARARMRADVPGKPKTDLTMLVIYTPDAAFLNMPEWIDSRRGKWMRLPEDSLASMGVPVEFSAPTAVPPGLDGFSPVSMPTSSTIEGTVDAESALGLLGATGALKDPELIESLTGRVPAVLTLDPSSFAFSKLEITGRGHTVMGNSSSMPSGALQQMLELATATLTIKQVGKPVLIAVPAARDVIPS